MGLFLEGLKFGEAYLQREICVHKSIGLASWLEVNLPFLCCFNLYLRATFQVQATSPPGAYIWRGDLTEGFLHHQFGGLIFGGAYFWNFTVFYQTSHFMKQNSISLTKSVPTKFEKNRVTKFWWVF